MNENFNYDLIRQDYEINDNDDDRLYDIKTALAELRPMERKIFLAYTEMGTFAAVARLFNVSSPTAKQYCISIKNKILNLMEK